METPHLYINRCVRTQSYLSYLIAIYVFQIKFVFNQKSKQKSF